MNENFLHRAFARRIEGRWPEAPRTAWDAPRTEASDEECAPWDDESDELSIEQMIVAAPRARGAELRRILRSRSERVLVAVLKNPELGPSGALMIARTAGSGTVLTDLARNRELSTEPEVARALCMNSRTPFFASRALLGHLPVHVLREISLATGVPPGLAKEALDAVAERRTRRQKKKD